MNITIKSTNVELTDAIQAYAEEKIGSVAHLVSPESAELLEARVELGKPSQHHHTGPVYYAEANLHMGGLLFRATAEHADLYAAIDMVKDELGIQLRKFKDKQISERRHTDPQA